MVEPQKLGLSGLEIPLRDSLRKLMNEMNERILCRVARHARRALLCSALSKDSAVCFLYQLAVPPITLAQRLGALPPVWEPVSFC